MVDRALLGFPDSVRSEFAFLADYGFLEKDSTPTLVRFSAGQRFFNVYHGRHSCELGVEIALAESEDAGYSLGELIRLADAAEADRMRYTIAMTPAQVRRGTKVLAEQVRQYAIPALRGDLSTYRALARQRDERREAFARRVRADQTRPRAQEAFRMHRYAEAAGLYESIQPSLTPAEVKKLEYARKKARP